MDLRGKNILLISPEPWNHVFVSKHHYAIHLANRGSLVFFLNPPSDSNKCERTTTPRLHVVDYKGFVRGLRFLPSFIRTWQLRKAYIALEKKCGVRFDIVWSFDNSVFFNFRALPSRIISICHMVDYSQDFQFVEAASTANYCFGVSDNIVEKLSRYNSDSYKIPHGYADVELIPFEVPMKQASVKIGYVGNLDLKYIDWKLIHEAVTQNRNAHFFFVGPFSEKNQSVHLLRKEPNTTFLGRVSVGETRSFLFQMDILILAYLTKQYTQQLTNSHKVLEYLASGKISVITALSEVAQPGLLVASNRDEWLRLLEYAVENMDSLSTQAQQEMRIKAAMANTYERHIERIESIVFTTIHNRNFLKTKTNGDA